MSKKNKTILVVTVIVLSIITAFSVYKWTSKSKEDAEKIQTAQQPTINLDEEFSEVSSENSEEKEVLDEEKKEDDENTYVDYSQSIPELFQNTFNYLASDNKNSITSMRYYTKDDWERAEEEAKVIPKEYNVNKFFCCKQTALDFAYSLNLTTPAGKLQYGELADNKGLIIETAKPKDQYSLTRDLEIVEITNSYSDTNNEIKKALDVTVTYKAGVSTAFRRYHIFFDDSGRIFDFIVTDMDTKHKETRQGGETNEQYNSNKQEQKSTE